MALISLRSVRTQVKRRCGPMRTLKGLGGAGLIPAQAIAPTPTRPRASRPASWRGPRTAARAPRTISRGTTARSSSASASSWASVGSGRGIQSCSGGATGAGSRAVSNNTVSRSTPEMPSTRAWWVLVRIAKRLSERPSANHSSHSGFERSSDWEKIRPASRLSSSSPPGRGSAVWRTWKRMLKWGSSTHTGRPCSNGTNARRCL